METDTFRPVRGQAEEERERETETERRNSNNKSPIAGASLQACTQKFIERPARGFLNQRAVLPLAPKGEQFLLYKKVIANY